VDIRLEAAIAKLFCSEAGWRLVDETMQIRGGRGYETARSLRSRGEAAIPVERMMRDARINLIIEGTSQIMRLFIAREALDAHLRTVGALLDPRQPLAARLRACCRVLLHYAWWYPRQWMHWGWWPRHRGLGAPLAGHVRFVERASRRAARALFHSAVRHQTRLAHRQQLLGRLVDIGSDLFAIAVACARAHAMIRLRPSERAPVELADVFCRMARRRIVLAFQRLGDNDDRPTYRLAQDILSGQMEWLEDGIV